MYSKLKKKKKKFRAHLLIKWGKVKKHTYDEKHIGTHIRIH